ncbi:Putative HMP/thiamine import ATP-binding protein YkoD [Aurantimicrobium sp. MWH-Uga1]|nr:Putative HMP/thiamine import ATP-binding protein YkoD [Aurantimicrobium sp. MWH-Uga1]
MLPGRSRWTPLWVSLSFAGFFIALRIIYRLLFGSFSWTAVGQAALLALPFAAVIIACGLLSSLIDFRKLLISLSGLKYSRSVGTALMIALASFPTLLAQVKKINTYRTLRGISSRFAVVVPVLEHTVEKSVAAAAAMELKGFASQEQLREATPSPITFDEYSLSFGNHTVLNNVSVSFAPGTVTVLTGATGSGKTSLLESIAGLSQHFHAGIATGTLSLGSVDRLHVPPRDTAKLIGFVPQNVRLSFTASTAREELEYTLRLHGETKEIIPSRIEELLGIYGLCDYADVPVDMLSAGQATRVALASALATSPHILLLDEPLADLDSASVSELIDILDHLRAAGMTIVLSEHHTSALESLDPRWLVLEAGKVTEGKFVPASSFPARTFPLTSSDQVLAVNGLEVTHGEKKVLSDVTFTARTGEIIALTGANGVGKTSLLTALSNTQSAGVVEVLGTDLSTLPATQKVSRIAAVPEEASWLFMTESLAEELEYADKIAGVPANTGLTKLTFRSLLSRDVLSPELLRTHPRDLSAGTQRALAIALQLSWKPGVITIDEPTRGLDPHSRSAMAEVLRCVAETGTVVVFATHDGEFARSLHAQIFTVAEGTLIHPEQVNA